MTKLLSAVVVIGLAYIIAIGVLFFRGEGIAAAYLTLPAWLLVGGFSFLLTFVVPDSVMDATVATWTGNFIVLVLSAALNVAGVYFVARRLSKP